MENQNRPGSSIPDINSRLADYAIVFELMGKLAGVTTEGKVIDNIFELFSMLFAPRFLAYAPVRKGVVRTALQCPEDGIDIKSLGLEGMHDESARTPSGKGFILRVGGSEKSLLGYLVAEEIAFTEHIEHYLNLALNIKGVLEISVANARMYEELVSAQKVLREERDRAQKYLKELEAYRGGLEDLVSERTARLENALEVLEQSNKDLEQFAYIISHDLQEPLRMVVSYMQLLESRYKGRLDEAADEFINYAVEGAKRMSAMIHGILAYSRVSTRGQPGLVTGSEAACANALANLSMAISESGAEVKLTPLPPVKFDEAQLTSLFQNLIDNAIKFRKPGEAPRIEVSAERGKGEWVFSVRDNGIGIDREFAERVFLIFKRLHGKEYPGTGIGLAICKKIVERHGGKIWVESEHGKGSAFFFTVLDKQTGEKQGGS